MMLLRIVFLIVFILIIELMFFYGLRLLFRGNKKMCNTVKRWNFYILLLFVVFTIFYVWYLFSLDTEYIRYRGFFLLFGLFYLMYLPKFLLGIGALMYGIQYLLFGLLQWIFYKINPLYSFFKIIRQQRLFVFVGLIFGILMFGLIAYGMLWGRYQYQLEKVTIVSNRIPKAFDGFKIVHISDAHLGSFVNPNKINKAINIINSTQPDLFLFTGDMVNDQAIEAVPFVSYFKQIKPRYGGFSVLGNHDMGDYRRWYDDKAKHQNLQLLDSVQQLMGLQLLRNTNVVLHKDNDSIIIAGVDNWGLPPFKQYGDLKKALQHLDTNSCIILLSHDPTHWSNEVMGKTSVLLTLSGHTHGMQMGIKFGKWLWSPVKFIYNKYAGLYQNKNQYLYINRGLGFIGYPGRFGMLPEITLITLQSQ